jgi:hypothetical protein
MPPEIPDYAYSLEQIVFHTESGPLSLQKLCMELGRADLRDEPSDVWFQVRFFDHHEHSGWFEASELQRVRELVREMQLRVRGENGPTSMAADVKRWVDEIVADAVAAAFGGGHAQAA